jgi:hypothetical protein
MHVGTPSQLKIQTKHHRVWGPHIHDKEHSGKTPRKFQVQVTILRSAHFYPWKTRRSKKKIFECNFIQSSNIYMPLLLNTPNYILINETIRHEINFSVLQSHGSILTPTL